MQNHIKIQLNIELWKEGNMYVAYAPQIDISSCRKTAAESKKNIREAVELFIEEAKKMGTLKEILEEEGFYFNNRWKAPEISLEKIKMAV